MNVNIDNAAEHLASMAFASVFLDDISYDEAALQLIALFESSKDEFTPEEQAAMKEIVLDAVKIVTGVI